MVPARSLAERHTATSVLVCGLDGNRSTRTSMRMQRGDPWKPRSLFSSRAASGENGSATRPLASSEDAPLKIRLKESTAVPIASFDVGAFTAVNVKRT